MVKNKKIGLLIICCLITVLSTAQITITKNSQPVSKIIIGGKDSINLQSALLLQDFVKKISGAELSIVSNTIAKSKGDILIGDFQLPIKGLDTNQIKEDGFFLSTDDGYIRIVGAKGKGALYGAVTLLEQYCNVQYYAAYACTYPTEENLSVPASIHRIDNPSFRYRQAQTYCTSDSLYKIWHRLKEPKEVFAGNLWVHTFNKILPADEFGKTHPEYFSFINGKRRPGTASQLCLTNPDVFEIVSHRVDSIFKANPGKNMISISQNDGNFTNCTCDKCKAIDDEEGGPSGTLIFFLNKLATRFPDKQFSTLAYLYSVSPPKHIKPLPNVNIMLCDIDCMREVPLTENASGKSFVKDMEGWAKISHNIFVWDYGINFDNYVSPFPNFHILQPNMQLFKKNNATMHFSQIGAKKGGDFSELRSYVVAKLLWNVNLNVDSLIRSFLEGYYGKASPFIYEYLEIQKEALLASHISLWIYDTPVSHKKGMLDHAMMEKYKSLFDKAEKVVAGEETFLKRVQESRLSIQYAELELARTEPIEDANEVRSSLNLFRHRAKDLGVSILNERGNTIEEYCSLYEQRNFPNERKSLALGAKVNYLLPPAKTYLPISEKALTDGLYGGATFNESWVGWEGKDATFAIDLGKTEEIVTVEADFLHKLGSWIFLPKSISCYTSVDNVHFDLINRKDIDEDRDPAVKFVNIPFGLKQKTKARYIKLEIENIGICPPWHYGVGYPAWFFIDEVSVY